MKGIRETKRKSVYVAEQIIHAIKRNDYKIGDKLPPERVIAEQMKVSRTAVREALSSLQALGIIESRIGDGNYVCGIVEENIDIDKALEELRESESLGEIWRARKYVEIALVKLAAEKATANDLANMKEILLKMEEALNNKKYDDYLSVNDDFHLSIARIANNTLLRQVLVPLLEITNQQMITKITRDYVLGHAPGIIDEHYKIFNAIETRDKIAAVRAIELHFALAEELFIENSEDAREQAKRNRAKGGR